MYESDLTDSENKNRMRLEAQIYRSKLLAIHDSQLPPEQKAEIDKTCTLGHDML